MTTDFVIDWETMGTSPDSVVLSLAFIPFERDGLESFQTYINNAYYWKFKIEPQIEDGRTINQDTLDWWDKQDPEVKKSQFESTTNDVTLAKMLDDLAGIKYRYGINNKSCGWCRGTSFDFPLFANIIKTTELEKESLNAAFFPCAFWQQRDIRSYIAGLMVDPNLTKVPLPKGSIEGFKHHDPVHDCARAILHIKYGEAYAKDEIEIPDEPDEFSNK